MVFTTLNLFIWSSQLYICLNGLHNFKSVYMVFTTLNLLKCGELSSPELMLKSRRFNKYEQRTDYSPHTLYSNPNIIIISDVVGLYIMLDQIFIFSWIKYLYIMLDQIFIFCWIKYLYILLHRLSKFKVSYQRCCTIRLKRYC